MAFESSLKPPHTEYRIVKTNAILQNAETSHVNLHNCTHSSEASVGQSGKRLGIIPLTHRKNATRRLKDN